MKKKILSLILAGVMVMSMAACAVKKPGAEDTAKDGDKKDSKGGYELALITDVGTIDDKSFNQGSWEGLEKYAKEHDITYKYYKPAEKSDEACLNAIDLAVKGGAKVVATPGFLFEVPVYEAQTKYPDVSFIIIDAQPVKDGEAKLEDNVLSIFYAEEQAGYLAGYAAVTEGYRNLGFMGGIAVPAVIRYGYGFVQGADAAAKDLGLAAGDVSVKYTYVGNFAGGTTLNLSAKDDGIQLPMETSKFTKFTQEKYDELYGKLKDGSIKVENDTVAEDATGVPAEIVKVELIK